MPAAGHIQLPIERTLSIVAVWNANVIVPIGLGVERDPLPALDEAPLGRLETGPVTTEAFQDEWRHRICWTRIQAWTGRGGGGSQSESSQEFASVHLGSSFSR